MNLIHRVFASLISIAFSSPVWVFCFLAFGTNLNSHAVIQRSRRREEYFFSSILKGGTKDADFSLLSTFPSSNVFSSQVGGFIEGFRALCFTLNLLQCFFSNHWDIPSWSCFLTVLKPFRPMPPKFTFVQILC